MYILAKHLSPGVAESEGVAILSYPILSYPIVSYPIVSHPILSYLPGKL